MLGTPPAFVLSQDQTLQLFKLKNRLSHLPLDGQVTLSCQESTRIRTHLSPPPQATAETKVRVLFAFQRPRIEEENLEATGGRPAESSGGVLYSKCPDVSNFEMFSDFK